MKLRNDKIIVFGGGSGIGKAIAKRFCDAGAKILITGRNEDKLKAAAEEINSENIYYKAFDITSINEHIMLFHEVAEILGGLNGFVNAAALVKYCLQRCLYGHYRQLRSSKSGRYKMDKVFGYDMQ